MKENDYIKSIWKFLHSMKFGIILLIVIGLLSSLGTIIPQGNSLAYYETNYSPLKYELIKNLSLYKVYTSWWFIVLISFLTLNLSLCSIKRFKTVIKMVREGRNIDKQLQGIENWENLCIEEANIHSIFKKLGFNNIKEKEHGQGEIYFSYKHHFGYLGSWLTHLGLIFIIVFFTYGKINGFEAFVHGVPGTLLDIEKTDTSLFIENFNIIFREDFTVDQYISKISLIKGGQEIDSGEVMVNQPFRAKQFNIYQNGTGWATKVTLYKDDKEYKKRNLYQGEFFIEDDQKIALQFVNFYPDFDSSSNDLKTISPYPNHPVMLYALFYDGYRVDMNLAHMGEEVSYGEYSFKIENPQMFTLLQIVRDPGSMGAFIGGGLLIIGIFLAFYINPKKFIIYTDEKAIKYYFKSYKNSEIYREELKSLIIGEE